MSSLTRRGLLFAALAATPAAAWAAPRRRDYAPSRGGVLVDVSPLRRDGDTIDADFLETALPSLIARAVGPGHEVRARVDDVTYGSPGSNGARDLGAVDSIQGVGWIDGREIPVYGTVQTAAALPDPGAIRARYRQDQLARSFADWLSRQARL